MMEVQIYSPQNKTANANPTIFLHGFPGVRSKQNRDVAQAVANATGRDAHVLLYSGLSQAPGDFSFTNCLADVHRYISGLFENGISKFDLVGHSWGGFLSLTIVQTYPERVRRLALMSPLLYFVEEAYAAPHFAQMAEDNPAVSIGDVNERAREFENMGLQKPTDDLIRQVPPSIDVLFLQARADETTPTSIALEKIELFPRFPIFELVDTDHSFLTGREWLAKRLSVFLNDGV